MMEVRDLIFGYKRKKTVLKGISFSLREGEVVGLLGPNGAGKTTLMHLLAGWTRPEKGSIRINGLEPFYQRATLHQFLGYCQENPPWYPWMRVQSLLTFLSQHRKIKREKAYRLWEVFGIDPHKTFQELSRGQRGLVNLSLVLAGEPRVLLLDDPTLGLDVGARRHLYISIISELTENKVTILWATHLPEEVEGLLDRALFLKDGIICEDAPLSILKERYAGSLMEAYLNIMEVNHGA